MRFADDLLVFFDGYLPLELLNGRQPQGRRCIAESIHDEQGSKHADSGWDDKAEAPVHYSQIAAQDHDEGGSYGVRGIPHAQPGGSLFRAEPVGDGIADAVLVERAKALGFGGLLFLGVVSSSEDSNKLFDEYSKHGADAVVTDVNDVPVMFASLKEVKP